MRVKNIGIIGAGKLGMVLAQLAVKAGYAVYVSGSGDPSGIKLTVETLAPGAVAATSKDVAKSADVVILALPLGKFRQLLPRDFADKLVIDATNYWWEVDGPRDAILSKNQSSSEAVQEHFSDSRIVKAFSHMGYHDLYDEAKPAGAVGRKAIAVAGDDAADVKTVASIVDTLGFDPLPIGELSRGMLLEPGQSAFGANLERAALKKLIEG